MGMTPTEQDKELRLEIARKVYPKPTPSEIMIWGTPEAVIDEVYSEAPIVYEFASYITADRKRVALEARIDTATDILYGFSRTYMQKVTDSAGNVYVDESHGYISKYELQELVAELKSQQEEV